MSGGDSQAAALMTVLGLEERDTDVFVGSTPRTRLQRIFGGQVAGQALMAAGLTVPGERGVHSLHSYFLRPGDPHEELRYRVERIRDGRSFSTRRVIACQRRGTEDVAVFALTADFHGGEPAVVAHARPMPEVPGPEELRSLADHAAGHGDLAAPALEISRAVEQRPLADPFAPDPKSPPDTRSHAWFRVAGRLPEDAAVHAAALTFVTDLTLLSAGLARVGGGWGGRYVGASLDHAVWFHAPVRADEWFLYETDSPAASAGRALCFGSIWSADGTHVATVAQEGLIRSLGD
ncbi:acyl-CoA thioesterase-2 [Geodermatophilus telluris]|uniref:Acyl-CoA thioesterase-2 n=1 Tax=Geodermatophilus telluris TaxID=1190417 RepID=A0A1G6S045_9ACTN|nr:acyl-CoA thioesterase domain-containing protein [Geodermatophilus telluris]SDD10198.1 acyl-CoA thioesterase-2 [Geodermatophilus telluris]